MLSNATRETQKQYIRYRYGRTAKYFNFPEVKEHIKQDPISYIESLSPASRRVLNVLGAACSNYSRFFASQATLAGWSKVKRRETVNRALYKLEADGIIKSTYRHRETCLYTIDPIFLDLSFRKTLAPYLSSMKYLPLLLVMQPEINITFRYKKDMVTPLLYKDLIYSTYIYPFQVYSKGMRELCPLEFQVPDGLSKKYGEYTCVCCVQLHTHTYIHAHTQKCAQQIFKSQETNPVKTNYLIQSSEVASDMDINQWDDINCDGSSCPEIINRMDGLSKQDMNHLDTYLLMNLKSQEFFSKKIKEDRPMNTNLQDIIPQDIKIISSKLKLTENGQVKLMAYSYEARLEASGKMKKCLSAKDPFGYFMAICNNFHKARNLSPDWETVNALLMNFKLASLPAVEDSVKKSVSMDKVMSNPENKEAKAAYFKAYNTYKSFEHPYYKSELRSNMTAAKPIDNETPWDPQKELIRFYDARTDGSLEKLAAIMGKEKAESYLQRSIDYWQEQLAIQITSSSLSKIGVEVETDTIEVDVNTVFSTLLDCPETMEVNEDTTKSLNDSDAKDITSAFGSTYDDHIGYG